MEVSIWGGAGEHGRSCYYIKYKNKSILFDCGGKKEKGGIYPLLDEEKVRNLDVVFLSHAHEDHSMGIPILYKMGFKGEVWTTKATGAQLPVYFRSWMSYVQRHGQLLPYNASDIDSIRFKYLEDYSCSKNWFEVMPDIQVSWGASGHMVGAVWLKVALFDKKVFFSGDYCAEPYLLHLDHPYASKNTFEIGIIDAAYGNDSTPQKRYVSSLIQKVKEVLLRGGHVLLPVPLYGRSQDLAVILGEYFADCPIMIEADIIKGLVGYSNDSSWIAKDAVSSINNLLENNRIIPLSYDPNSIEFKHHSQPHIIIATESMLLSTKGKFFAEQVFSYSHNAVLFTGNIISELNTSEAKCEVGMYRYKVHQDKSDVSKMVEQMIIKKKLLVHAIKPKTDLLREKLLEKGITEIHSLSAGDRLKI